MSSAYLEPLPGVATLAPAPLSYSLTLYAVIECLATGGTVHVADRFDAIDAGRRIERESITRIVAVPAILQALAVAARRSPERFASLSVLVTGGANLPASIRQAAAVYYTRRTPHQLLREQPRSASSATAATATARASASTRASRSRCAMTQGRRLPTANSASSGCWLTPARRRLPLGHDRRGPGGRKADGRPCTIRRAWSTGDSSWSAAPGDIAIAGGHKVALTEVERVFEGVAGVDAACAVALPDRALG